jgi:hypothetical protein
MNESAEDTLYYDARDMKITNLRLEGPLFSTSINDIAGFKVERSYGKIIREIIGRNRDRYRFGNTSAHI